MRLVLSMYEESGSSCGIDKPIAKAQKVHVIASVDKMHRRRQVDRVATSQGIPLDQLSRAIREAVHDPYPSEGDPILVARR